ncbi:MAG: tRNA pseudouridine(38-40) synthase TruA [Clostridia bacterium]|nr:tRNA pseudouridine(38-40) synthase TruA [Clostridia bacterium]
MTRRIRFITEYDGTNYVGWQDQPNGTAVQELLEKAVFETTGEKTTVQGSGRTDSGVHARAQVAHFDTEARMAADKFAYALNTRLPQDIRVLWSEEAPEGFHSRFSAKYKQYRYAVQTGPHARVFTRNNALHCYSKLDFDKMQRAAEAVTGEHDFRAFMCKDTKMENTVRTVYLSEWRREGEMLYYNVAGNGFLYNMVRILVGTMLDIGAGRKGEEAIAEALTGCDRNFAGATAPAKGLTLWRVRYADFDTEEILSKL